MVIVKRRVPNSAIKDKRLLFLGANIVAARKARGWSQGELARRSHTNPTRLSAIELGVGCQAGLYSLLNIADALNLPLDYLLGRTPRQQGCNES